MSSSAMCVRLWTLRGKWGTAAVLRSLGLLPWWRLVGSALEFSGHTLHECAVLRDSLHFCDHTQRTAGSFLYCGLFQPLNLIGSHTKAKPRLFIPSALSPLRPSFKKVGYLERTCRRRTVRATLGSDTRLRRAHHQWKRRESLPDLVTPADVTEHGERSPVWVFSEAHWVGREKKESHLFKFGETELPWT